MSNKSSSANRLFQILFLTLSKPILDLEKFLSPPEIFDPLIHSHSLSLSSHCYSFMRVYFTIFSQLRFNRESVYFSIRQVYNLIRIIPFSIIFLTTIEKIL